MTNLFGYAVTLLLFITLTFVDAMGGKRCMAPNGTSSVPSEDHRYVNPQCWDMLPAGALMGGPTRVGKLLDQTTSSEIWYKNVINSNPGLSQACLNALQFASCQMLAGCDVDQAGGGHVDAKEWPNCWTGNRNVVPKSDVDWDNWDPKTYMKCDSKTPVEKTPFTWVCASSDLYDSQHVPDNFKHGLPLGLECLPIEDGVCPNLAPTPSDHPNKWDCNDETEVHYHGKYQVEYSLELPRDQQHHRKSCYYFTDHVGFFDPTGVKFEDEPVMCIPRKFSDPIYTGPTCQTLGANRVWDETSLKAFAAATPGYVSEHDKKEAAKQQRRHDRDCHLDPQAHDDCDGYVAPNTQAEGDGSSKVKNVDDDDDIESAVENVVYDTILLILLVVGGMIVGVFLIQYIKRRIELASYSKVSLTDGLGRGEFTLESEDYESVEYDSDDDLGEPLGEISD